MSFGGAFSGFGSNNQASSGGFGFGANKSNTTSGFGSAFGSSNNNNNTSGPTLFGSGSTAGGFGSGGGFGSTSNNNNNNNTFGGSSGFGANTNSSSGGGLFGGSNNNASSNTGSGFGGFGNTPSNTTNTNFGSGGGGLFGTQNKTSAGFGSTGTTGGSIFGGGSGGGTSSGAGAFGASSSGAFGAPPSTALASNVGDPPGTNSVAFNAFQEKEPNGTTNNTFQNLLFQEPYRKWSADELRLTDYMQGRKHGNASGGGAFGVGSGFGGASGFGSNTNNTSSGFGSTNNSGGLFGGSSNTNTSTSGGFGSTTATSGGFGTSSSGGLFGQNKPATGGGLFGGSNTNNNATGGFGSTNTGAFGGSNNTSTGFGSNAGGTSGGLFGSNATQNKPGGFGGFGTSNNASTGGAFGSTNTGTGTGFGTSTNTGGGGLFGASSNTQSNTPGGLFGGNNSQQSNTGGSFGGGSGFQLSNQQPNTSGGLFGNNNQQQQQQQQPQQQQQKPGGLFGASTNTGSTGGGLFGGNNASNNAFGANNAQSGGTGLFGGAKPASTGGGGLFGSSAQQQNTGATGGGGLFGSLGQSNQNQQSSGLFGSGNQNQQKPSLFGTPTAQNTSTGLFGGSQNANQSSNSLFGGGMNQQQQQNTGLGNSIFSSPQNNAQGGQQSLTASVTDVSAYGTSSLFSGMGGNEPQNPGPLATPLSNKSKPRRSSILPMYKLNPASASRFSTPQKRGGFGFSYSTYGTPGSASSVNSTPGGMNQSLLGSSTRGLKPSVSTSSLRRSFNAEDSILTPGAFSTSNQRFGSVKKLVINRDMRSDLFATPQKDKSTDPGRASRLRKHVSFEDPNSETESTPLSLPAPPIESQPSPQDASTPTQNAASNGISSGSHDSAETPKPPRAVTTSSPKTNSSDPTPGKYWMRPSIDEILDMPRSERAAVSDFTVGRVNVGSVQFLTPVDLSGIDVENLFRDIIDLEPRSATVYKNPSKKPPPGMGLNVPAKISLEQSWPRHKKNDGRAESRIKKHIDRLRRIPDTTFIHYNQDNGVWTFRVEHFTTYGLDYDDDEDSDAEPSTAMTGFSDNAQSDPSTRVVTEEVPSPGFNSDDDTFDFQRKRRALPGAFDYDQYDYEAEAPGADPISQPHSFLADRSVGSVSNELVPVSNEVDIEEEYDVAMGQGMASPTPGNYHAAEHEHSSPDSERLSDVLPETPGGIMRARMRAIKDSTVPTNMRVADGDDWQDMLQRTISPQKRDRAWLKSLNAEDNYESLKESIGGSRTFTPRHRMASDARGFATSIDLMNSLFDKSKGPAAESAEKGFVKWPYERTKKVCDETDMSAQEQAYHKSIRPTWGPDGTIVFATAPRSLGKSSFRSIEKGGLLSVQKGAVSSEHREIRIGKFSNECSASALREQMSLTKFQSDSRGIPSVKLTGLASIKTIFHEQNSQNLASTHEKLVWELASVLFDDLVVPADLEGTAGIETRIRRQQVSRFWQALVDDAASRCVTMGRSSEEKAIACLSGHRIPEACKHLLGANNFRLATLVSTIGTNDKAKADIQEQLKQWQDNKYLSEFSDPIRALYSLLAGEVFVCLGRSIGPVEDRLSSFAISQQFGLDWKQAFGLRLWYALHTKDDVSVAVRKFQADVAKDEVFPKTWYMEQGIEPIWDDEDKEAREDLLWGLLKLYADPNTDLEAVLRPENSQLSPLDFRLSWQLGRALTASAKASFGPRGNEKADSATISFATQLVNEGSWLEAAFVLLHLSNPEARVQAVKEHLARHAGNIGDGDSESFTKLVSGLKIPAAWVWEAKALFMRSVQCDAASEVQCLLQAGAFNDAHHTFVRRVAPQAIIERDYRCIADLLAQFAGHEGRIPDWRLGGEVYRDFLRLVGLQSRPEHISGQLVDKLLSGLPAMQEHAQGLGAAAGTSGAGNEGVEATAAIMEMGSIVARTVIELGRRGQNQDISRVLGLPLAEDGYLKHSMDLSLAYYKELMAGGR
ncbi:nucleoporin autopeptidase [Zalerion maritima]|uniref:Nucleoporin autopeptidase n=1 Tax=Zalerion maritima TaxID=339359 RepID=A0AAD5RXH4_9PEZI|nr:nucleoporin autopeptidase [Zalerion maritima]